ncbi:MAG: terminase large subunit domain-containing protein, partial [Alphaproteobacteria bacterium]
MSAKHKIDAKLAKETLWRRGHLSWLLDANQKQLYDLYYNTEHRVQTWLLARRSGKSYALCVLAIETCLKKPGAIIKFLAPTRVQVNLIIRPLMRKILESCPDDLKPEYRAKDNIFYFPNGAELQLSGTDGGSAERLRGGDSDLAIVDEAGSCTDLKYCVKDILLPTTLITKGKILLASTPPEDAEHDFVDFIEEAEARGSIVVKTIDDNPRIETAEKVKLIEELGGPNSESTLRELYCKMIKSKTNSVVPEFTEEKIPEIVSDQFTPPPFYDAYVSM